MSRLIHLFRLLVAAIAVVSVWSCTEQIDTSARYVFKEETVMSYLEKHEAYSSYVDILRKVDISKASSSKVGGITRSKKKKEAVEAKEETVEVVKPEAKTAN